MNSLSSEEFMSNVLENEKLVLVDFYATWCGPCKMLAPVLEQISEEGEGKYDIFKVDVDDCADIAKTYGIMSIPTMIVFKNGKPVETIIGLRSKKDISEILNNNI